MILEQRSYHINQHSKNKVNNPKLIYRNLISNLLLYLLQQQHHYINLLHQHMQYMYYYLQNIQGNKQLLQYLNMLVHLQGMLNINYLNLYNYQEYQLKNYLINMMYQLYYQMYKLTLLYYNKMNNLQHYWWLLCNIHLNNFKQFKFLQLLWYILKHYHCIKYIFQCLT